MPHVYQTRDLVVRQSSGSVYIIVPHNQPSRVLAGVVADKVYPGMWRVVDGDKLSDMVNLSCAIDAAMPRALSVLNRP